MFLMNCWYVAAWDHELIDGKLLARTILEKPVLIYRGNSGRVVALDPAPLERAPRRRSHAQLRIAGDWNPGPQYRVEPRHV